ncbi:helix-turn-helix domain-containing protein [Asanoa iriomotensis]|uniref:XRE family transcriptional regulator n=1 Tax=Asanoa iriomotensis TaxID=234613 RepID=A0ABQ4CCJ9_9ACTN|nr:helix-turn-helix transcriptional regulator [Asanoa iriomotensis]GIF60481.1 XRE family transcriptional regulator [Asanoa iriomotensis]
MADREELPALRTMQERLRFLFQTVRPPGKARYSFRQVAEAIKTEQGVEISGQYIQQIESGERRNPGVVQVRALAGFFGVPPEYLLGVGDTDKVTGELRRLREAIEVRERLDVMMDDAMRDPDLQGIVLKARGVPPRYLQLVAGMLDEVRRIEGLDEVTDQERA